MPFSHEVGFYGVASMGTDKLSGDFESVPEPGAEEQVSILATGGSLNLNTEPMFSTGVWGAGWYNAANQVAYAFNVVTLEGDISFELLAGDIFTAVKNFAFENRAETYGTYLKMLPNGKGGYKGPVWCSSCSFEASEGAVVTGSLNYSSDYTTGFTTTPQNGTKFPGAGVVPTPANGLFPFWATGMSHLPQGVTNWSASYSSEINFLTLCKPGVTTQQIKPDFITVGGMDAEGSFTVFGLSSEINPMKLTSVSSDVNINMYAQSQYALHATDNAQRVVSGSPYQIHFAYVVYGSGSTALTTGGDYITADISFTAIGDGTKPPLDLIQGGV